MVSRQDSASGSSSRAHSGVRWAFINLAVVVALALGAVIGSAPPAQAHTQTHRIWDNDTIGAGLGCDGNLYTTSYFGVTWSNPKRIYYAHVRFTNHTGHLATVGATVREFNGSYAKTLRTITLGSGQSYLWHLHSAFKFPFSLNMSTGSYECGARHDDFLLFYPQF